MHLFYLIKLRVRMLENETRAWEEHVKKIYSTVAIDEVMH